MTGQPKTDLTRGVSGRRNPDCSKYQVKRHFSKAKPPPPDFRETFIEIGYDAERWYQCRWKVFRRWLDECGGPELLEARREYVRKNGFNRGAQVRHVKGWTAERLEGLRGAKGALLISGNAS